MPRVKKTSGAGGKGQATKKKTSPPKKRTVKPKKIAATSKKSTTKKEAEESVPKKRRGRPPKKTAPVQPVAKKKKRGRPPKATEELKQPVAKKKRGRPPKVKDENVKPVEKKKRGRPPKSKGPAATTEKPKRKRGRPPKSETGAQGGNGDGYKKFGPVTMPRQASVEEKQVLSQEDHDEICRRMLENYGFIACNSLLCQSPVCKLRKKNVRNALDNIDILEKYGCKRAKGLYVIMQKYDEILDE